MSEITQDDILTALAIEARRRGTTYGHMMAHTTEKERRDIVIRYLILKVRTKRNA